MVGAKTLEVMQQRHPSACVRVPTLVFHQPRAVAKGLSMSRPFGAAKKPLRDKNKPHFFFFSCIHDQQVLETGSLSRELRPLFALLCDIFDLHP